MERDPGPATEESFRQLTGSDAEFRSWQQFYAEMHSMAEVLAPMLTGPLQRRADARDAVIAAAGEQIWTDVVEKPHRATRSSGGSGTTRSAAWSPPTR